MVPGVVTGRLFLKTEPPAKGPELASVPTNCGCELAHTDSNNSKQIGKFFIIAGFLLKVFTERMEGNRTKVIPMAIGIGITVSEGFMREPHPDGYRDQLDFPKALLMASVLFCTCNFS
jgi:hypothetical protein